MTTTTLQKALLKAYADTLDKNSKWYQADVDSFNRAIQESTPAELKARLARLQQFTNPNSAMNKAAKLELRKLDRAGMFDVGRLKPENAID